MGRRSVGARPVLYDVRAFEAVPSAVKGTIKKKKGQKGLEATDMLAK